MSVSNDMNPEDVTTLVCSPGCGKRLQDLGVRRESFFLYTRDGTLIWPHYKPFTGMRLDRTRAWTVGELGRMLPNTSLVHHAFVACKGSSRLPGASHTAAILCDPDFVCDMLVWLIKQGDWTVEDINNAP